VAAALALRNQILTTISNTAARLGTQRGGDYAARAYSVLNQAAGRVFSADTYRPAYEWLMGRPVQQGMQVHHIFPQSLRSWFASRGLNVDLPTWLIEVESGFHGRVSPAYTAAWRAFKERFPNASIDQIFDRARHLMNTIFQMEPPF
jgi:hypothetical protein